MCIRDSHEGVTPLGIACVAGNWRLAKFLLERGAKPEPQNGLPVLLAAAATEEDDPVGVQLLLKHKAKADTRDSQGRSALHEAALAGHADIIAALLHAGADVQARDVLERTPWLEAARGGHLAASEALAEAGSLVTAVDGEGRNALMLACTAESVSYTHLDVYKRQVQVITQAFSSRRTRDRMSVISELFSVMPLA